MKKIIVAINFVCILLSVVSGLKGSIYTLILIVPYGLALGAILSKQKRSFYIATIVANAILLVIGAIVVYAIATGDTAISGLSAIILWDSLVLLLYVITPIFNIKYAK